MLPSETGLNTDLPVHKSLKLFTVEDNFMWLYQIDEIIHFIN